VLVFETCDIYADSIICTIDNLGVACSRASCAREFEDKLASGRFAFAFVDSDAYENVRDACQKHSQSAKIVVLASFGSAVADHNLSILSMPAFSLSVANILNGTPSDLTFDKGAQDSVRFEAPGVYALVVDDVATNLNVAKGLLLLYGIQSKLCSSGMEAIEAIQKPVRPKLFSASRNGIKAHPPKLRYEFVLMDHMMPGLDGIETTARIRALGGADPYFKNVPIIALTANAVIGAKEMFLAKGFNDFLPKPVEMAQLNAVLEKWVPKEKQKKTFRVVGDRASVRMEIEGLDTAKGLARAGGSKAGYIGTLNVFLRDGREKLKEIREALETDNLPLFAIHAHALKSASAHVGATGLSELAKSLEMAGKQEDLAFIQDQAPKLLDSLEKTLAAISSAVGKGAADDRPAAPADMAQLKALLARLKEAIDGIDPRAIREASEALQPFSKAEGVGGAVENILGSIQDGQDDKAEEEIEALMGRLQGADG
jgi:CheY-like chemotaxis protein/HPt (histidine-containing phosphotransfer) domain-containing protein